jgi:hypothetical protein
MQRGRHNLGLSAAPWVYAECRAAVVANDPLAVVLEKEGQAAAAGA